MHNFEQTRLWKSSLAQRTKSDEHATERTRLREAFIRFRANVATLAGEIGRDAPNRTVHDITHLDALWDVADIIVGEDFALNPLEAFVLGGTFLVHDLAMCKAAYPGGVANLQKEAIWQDSLHHFLRQKLGRAPREDEKKHPDADTIRNVWEDILVAFHAKQAEVLPIQGWKLASGDVVYLIEDREIRQALGPTIGKIAHSHWWSIDKVSEIFTHPLGAPGWCPSWSVDTLKLALLLRAADACHIDERRAPAFLQRLRGPADGSDDYWTFQSLLLQVQNQNGQLLYTVKSPFNISQSKSWWLCYDALQMAHRELQSIDSLLASKKSPYRLAARSVAHVETAEAMSKVIFAEGWLPVDARVHVSDVAGLAEKLGGRQLYGFDAAVPLRELIQNGIDAVRARRFFEAKPQDWGDVHVRLTEDRGSPWLEVEDNGIGMSKDVIVGPLLDFGVSYWGSALQQRELPGLIGKGFSSIGKFGVGFFSVFMWADQIQVISRRPSSARSDTVVLEFGKSIHHRPILRPAATSEQLHDGGTRVRLRLRDDPRKMMDFLAHETLEELCIEMCPAIDANLFARDGHVSATPRKLIAASDWQKMNGGDFLKRLGSYKPEKSLASRLQKESAFLKDSTGYVIGRACIGDSPARKKREGSGIVVVGGIRAGYIGGFTGVLFGSVDRATRDNAVPHIPKEELAKWATSQAKEGAKHQHGTRLIRFAEVVRACGGDVSNLPIAKVRRGWWTGSDIEGWNTIPDTVILVEDSNLPDYSGKKGLVIASNVLAFSEHRGLWSMTLAGRHTEWPEREMIGAADAELERSSMRCAIMEFIAKNWGCGLEDIVRESGVEKREKVGTRSGRTVKADAYVIKKPLPKK